MAIFLDEFKEFSIPMEVRSNLLWEGINSLHPLWLPDDHGDLLSWVSNMKAVMGKDLIEKNGFLQEQVGAWFIALSSAAIAQELPSDWREAIKVWRSTPALDFFRPVLEEQIDLDKEKEEIKKWFLQTMENQPDHPHSLFRGFLRIIESPEETKKEVLGFLEEYLPLFAASYEEHKGQIREFCEHINTLIKKVPLRDFFKRISPFLILSGEGVLEITHHGNRFDLKKYRKVILAPSFFFGHRYTLPYKEFLIFCLKPDLEERGISEPDKELLRKIEALSDNTNLVILKFLSRDYLCTRDLVERLKISQPLVTKHLSELKVCGFLYPIYKIKNRIYLTLNYLEIKKALDQVFDYLKSPV
jgi:DNA-binding transcriptional ArsR family regulator